MRPCIVSSVLLALLAASAAAVPAGFVVVRNVKDYGAVGDGQTDDTAAFIKALTSAKATIERAGAWNNSQYGPQTTMPSMVYVPSGSYKITSTLPVPYYTQLVGDHEDRPWLLCHSSWGQAPYRCLDAGTDEGPGNGWYGGANQNNFYRQLRNIIIDARECYKCTVVHWMVAQATVIENTDIIMKPYDGTGVYMESGSGGYMGDIRIVGGYLGLSLGNQQFTFRNISFENTTRAIDVQWNWIMTFAGMNFKNVKEAFYSSANAGSVNFFDCNFTNVEFAFMVYGHATMMYVENAVMTDVKTSLASLFQDRTEPFANYLLGRDHTGAVVATTVTPPARPVALVDAHTGRYASAMRPLYAAADVVVLNLTNGTDISDALELALANVTGMGKAALLPYGTYLISRTVNLPVGTRLFGQAWTRIAATGTFFSDPASPQPVFRLGATGDAGVMQLSDLLFTSVGPVPGAVMLEWNVAAPPGSSPDTNGAWDVHFRLGGAQGTGFDASTCPTTLAFESAGGAACRGAHTLLHLTPSAGNVYIQNMWGWTADHDIDSGIQTNVFTGRGLVSEAGRGGVWMYGMAFEHNYLGQFILAKPLSPHLIAIAQTETPYYQPMFALNASTAGIGMSATDPNYNTAAAPNQRHAYGLAFNATASGKLVLFGAGLYSFFENWNSSSCGTVVTPCQQAISVLTLPAGVANASTVLQAVNINTHGARDLLDILAVNGAATPYEAMRFPDSFCQTGSFITD